MVARCADWWPTATGWRPPPPSLRGGGRNCARSLGLSLSVSVCWLCSVFFFCVCVCVVVCVDIAASSWLWPPLVQQLPDSSLHTLALASSPLPLPLPTTALVAKLRSISLFVGDLCNSIQALDAAEEARLHSGVRYVTQAWEWNRLGCNTARDYFFFPSFWPFNLGCAGVDSVVLS